MQTVARDSLVKTLTDSFFVPADRGAPPWLGNLLCLNPCAATHRFICGSIVLFAVRSFYLQLCRSICGFYVVVAALSFYLWLGRSICGSEAQFAALSFYLREGERRAAFPSSTLVGY
jgi:hypothetical protein